MKKLALIAVATAATSLAACGRATERRKPLPPDQAAEVLHSRIWLDHAPKSMRDRFTVAVFDEGGSAIIQQRTVWKGEFELFFHEVDGGELEYFLPASGTSMRSTFHVVAATGPDNADHKLIVDHPPTGPREYWGWPAEGHSADAWLAAHYGRRE